MDLPKVDCERAKAREEVARRERKSGEEQRSHGSTCSARGILNLICILLARKNWVLRKYLTARLSKVLETFRARKAVLVSCVYIRDRGVNSFEGKTTQLKFNETKRTGL